MNCPSCQTPIIAGTSFCSACGNRLAVASRPGQAACAAHPELAAVKTCPRCGNFACPGCLVMLPGGVELCRRCESSGLAGFLPWDRREELGTLRAWWQTSMKLISAPNVTFAQTPQDGSLGSSLLFASISYVMGMLTTLLLYAIILGGVFAFGGMKDGPFEGTGAAAGVAIGVGIFLAYFVMLVVMGMVSLMFMSALDHLALKLVGANPGPWTVTVRAGALSMAPYLVGLIPLCGLYVFPIWSIVLKVFAYRALHRTTGGKAAAGALLPVGALMVLFIGLYAAVIVAVLALAPKH
ncbi:MAG: YIP1 family protein [Myxococcaceae bacterium]